MDKMATLAESRQFDTICCYDQHATIDSWKTLMEGLALQSKAGDIFFITQSSHGTYWDIGGNKRATGICMYDGVIWDYEVREIFKKFAKKSLIVWATDCCYSESNWRMVGVPASLRSKKMPPNPEKIAEPVPTAGDKRSIKASVITYSSSSIHQPSYETHEGGVFTNALIKSLSDEPDLSYYSLFKRIGANIKLPQTPVFDRVKAEKITGNQFLTL